MADDPRPSFAVFDIDGVLADVRHRLGHLAGRPKDWDAFFAAAVDDPVLPEGRALLDRLSRDHVVVYLTGRPERCRRDTLTWFAEHGFPAAELHMRSDRDRRPARTTKLEVLRRLSDLGSVEMVVDDDDRVVAAVREAGLPVVHATWMTDPDPPDVAQREQATLFDAQERDGRT